MHGEIIASIVVPTYKRLDLLARTLDALCDQSFPADRYEVLVADDANSLETRQLVEAKSAEVGCRLRYVSVGPEHGPATARNCGWRAAVGEILAFTDDDCLPDRDWLAEGVSYLQERDECAAAWGRIEMPVPEHPTDYQRDAAGLASAVFVTANCFVRRSVMQAVGGFDQRFRVAWREDSDLYYTLLEHQLEIGHAAAAVVVHPVRPAPWGVSLWQQSKSRFDVLLYRKHPQLYRRFVPPFPRLYVWNVAAGMLGLIALVFGEYSIGGFCAGIWLLTAIWFAWRRLHGTSRKPGHIAEMLVTSLAIPWLAIYHRLVGMWKWR